MLSLLEFQTFARRRRLGILQRRTTQLTAKPTARRRLGSGPAQSYQPSSKPDTIQTKHCQNIAKPNSAFNPTKPGPKTQPTQNTKPSSDCRTPTSSSPRRTCFTRTHAVLLKCTFCQCENALLQDIQILLRGSWKIIPPDRQRFLMQNGIV